MSLEGMVVKETTNDFCECFATKDDCRGIMARMVATMCLPEAVDGDDPRVQQIVQWCKENEAP